MTETKEVVYCLYTTYATACVVVWYNKGSSTVVQAAPIYKKHIGRNYLDLMRELFWSGRLVFSEVVPE